MDRIVHLDRSLWSDEALARISRCESDRKAHKALQAARAAHPLAGALHGLDDAVWPASEAVRLHVQARDFGNGHKEALVMAVKPGNAFDVLERAIDRDVKAPRAKRGDGDREASIESAVQRARKTVRLKAKAMAVNSLWTLTYRANVTDRDLVRRHLKLFAQAVRRTIGEWRYIAVLEKQERGAYHVHLATHALPVRLERGGVKVKSWDVMRAIWRRITGELGGNFDESKARKRWGKAQQRVSASGVARYLAGYVAKDMRSTELNRQRFTTSEGIALPEVYRAQFSADVSMRELIELAYAAVGHRITGAWFDPERRVFFIESDDTCAVPLVPS